MAGGIRSLDSFMESYSEPAWLDEKPQSFASALKEWQQIQENYYKNDKAKMANEDKEEERKKNKELEKKKLELGVTLDPDDLQGSIRKVIDFSKGEGDINTSLRLMGQIYQMDKAEKKEREAAARKALGITKKEQAKLEKAAQEKEMNGFLMAGMGDDGFTPETARVAINLAIKNGNIKAAKDIADFTNSVFKSKKESSSDDSFTNGLINNSMPNNNTNNGATYEGQRATGLKVGSVVRYDDGKTYQVGKDGNLHLLK